MAGGGGLPPVLNVIVALTLALPVCVLLAGRRLSWTRLSVAVGLSQFVFHLLLSVPLVPSGTMVSGHHGKPVQFNPVAIPTLPMDHLPMDPSMWVAHAIAAAVTVVALGRGELAVAAVAYVLGLSTLVALRSFCPLQPAPVLPLPAGVPMVPAGRELFSVVRRRGPPTAR